MKQTICIALAVVLALLSYFDTLAATKYSYSSFENGKDYFFSDGKSSCYVSVSDNQAIINTIGKEYTKVTFDNNIRYCHMVNNKIYFLIRSRADFTRLAVYNLKSKTYEYKNYGNFEVKKDYYCTPDIDGNIYLIGSEMNKMYIYSPDGEIIKKYKFIDGINQVTTFDGKRIVVLTMCINYVIESLKVTELGNSYVDYPMRFLSNRYGFSRNKIYDLNNNCNVIKNCNDSLNAVFNDGFVWSDKGDIIYSPFDNKYLEKTYSTNDSIEKLFADSKGVYAFTPSSIYALSEKDFKKADKINSTISTQNSSDDIDNDSYNITQSYVTDIKAKTTVSTFKKSLSDLGYKVAVINNSAEKTSGYIGTGMVIKLSEGSNTKSYRAVVNGDVTGEGSINTKDTKHLMSYLLKKDDLSDCERLSANLVNDNKISNADLVKMAQMKK